jgi:threonine synthase
MLQASNGRVAINTNLRGFVCLRCDFALGIDDYDSGCPRCDRESSPSNVAARYAGNDRRIQLPYPHPVTQGEGHTPLIDLPEIAAKINVGRVSLKLEGCNPTGSHKDRMSAQLLTRALHRKAGTVVGASSGNGGLSIASYAARAGLNAEIVATPSLSPSFRSAMEACGAHIILEADSLSRWDHVARRVRDGAFAVTNYALPAVGTNAFGIEGYKTIAGEIAETGAIPDLIIVPTARGDLLSGLALGFLEIGSQIPRLIAVEPFPRLARVLAGEDYRQLFDGATRQFSIAGPTVTFQTLRAIRISRGAAIVVDDEKALAASRQLLGLGLHAELSSAASLAALTELASGSALQGRHALLVLTGNSRDRLPTVGSTGHQA